jgi:protein TonB
MFESVRQGSQLNAMSYFTSALISLITHALIFCVMVSLPLIFYSPLSSYSPLAWVIDSPALAEKIPPPPPPSASATSRKAAARPEGIVYEGQFDPPQKIPTGIPPPADPPGPAGISRLKSGAGLGIEAQEPADGSWIADLLDEPAPELQPPEPPAKPEWVQVFSALQESKLMFKVNPVYPEIAIRARVSGTVVLSAIIDEEGSITNLKVLSGHPFLTKAAVEAVSQWKYRPTILNGEPVSVSAVVTVVFRIQ